MELNWFYISRLDRHEMFDFVPIVADGLVLAMYPQPPEYDVGLFVRPYRQERYMIQIYNDKAILRVILQLV